MWALLGRRELRFLLFVREQREAQLESDGVTLTFYGPLKLVLLPLQLCARAVRGLVMTLFGSDKSAEGKVLTCSSLEVSWRTKLFSCVAMPASRLGAGLTPCAGSLRRSSHR